MRVYLISLKGTVVRALKANNNAQLKIEGKNRMIRIYEYIYALGYSWIVKIFFPVTVQCINIMQKLF